ncbi:MAG: hypothetical protein NTZ44_01680 [Candidatus Nomurabacteria bacterium]|nr:hypothetical protein [Candidatus Nomurabacteria bacterium]
MKKFLRLFPVEVYVIVIPTILFFLTLGLKHLDCYIQSVNFCNTFPPKGDYLSSLLENTTIPVIMSFLCIYLIFHFVLLVSKRSPDTKEKSLFNIRSFIFIFGLLYISALVIAFETKTIFFTADPIRTAQVSELLMHTDKFLFGSYVPFSLHHLISSNIVSQIFYNSYIYLFPTIFVIIIISLFSNKKIFRKFMIAYFLAFLIALPIWIHFPAISPDSMYRANILNANIPTEIKKVVENTPILPSMQKNIS